MSKDVASRIKAFNANREPAVLPLKYMAMSADIFAFFRGSCHIFYEDLLKTYPLPPSPLSWICGDLHIENFGSYKGENRLLYFDLNDFDEAVLVPVLYETARLVVSVDIAATIIGFSAKEKAKLVQQLLQQYRSTLINNKSVNIEKETANGLIRKLIERVAERKSNSLLLSRTNNKFNNKKLLISSRLLAIAKEEKKLLMAAFETWFKTAHGKTYRVNDVGFRIAGIGSLGVKRYLFLVENEAKPFQKKLIDVKLALPSCILKYTEQPQPNWQNEADRIVHTQQMMQHVAPAFLTSFFYNNEWYVVKALQPTSDKISLHNSVKEFGHIEKYVADLGVLAASAQLRSSGRYKSATADELKAFAEREDWIKVITDWGTQYAVQVKKHYEVFLTNFKAGFYND